jgi:hypothetical protein
VVALLYFGFRGLAGEGARGDEEEAPKPPPELEECERCGRKAADLSYHRRRCKGSSRPFKHSEIVRGFKRRERKDRLQ